MYIHACGCVYIYIYTHIHIYIYICVYIYIYIYVGQQYSFDIVILFSNDESFVQVSFPSTVGFHNFNLRIFNLRVSNPKI